MKWTSLLFTSFVAALVLCAPTRAQDAGELIENYGLQEASTPVRERAGWRKPRRILVGGWARHMALALRRATPDIEFVTVGSLADAVDESASIDAAIGLCSSELFERFESIQWVQLLTAGVEQCVRIPAVRDRGVLVTNMQRIGGPIIAEHAIAMILAFTRGLDIYIPAQARREWLRATPSGRMAVVNGKNLLVVGLGGIGSEVAQRAHALGMRVIATRASGRSGPAFVDYVGLPNELLKLAREADFIVNTVPLTPATSDLFDAEFFEAMKESAYFVNVARGGSVDTQALVDALEQKKIAGAALDVTDPEPLPPDHPLWSAPNVIITPHVASESDLGVEAQLVVIIENLRRYSAGERMLSVVDVEKGY